MKKQLKVWSLLLASLAVIGTSCEGMMEPKGDINDPDSPKGSMSVSITDAPIDNADVSGAFVTVTEIKIDGETYSGFQGPKTINVLALQNGNSLELGQMDVAAGSYTTLDLVIDAETDDAGTGPGCYVQKTDGTKEKLELSGNGETTISLKPSNFTVQENAQTDIIVDFDLRKAIKSNSGNMSFVSKSKLETAVRAENKAITGTIKGSIQNYGNAAAGAVVYVYKKGQFDADTEVKGDVKYENAVTSAMVDGSGNFTLAFLPEGNYEIHCDKPEENSEAGLGLNTLLEISSDIDLSNVGVNAGAQTSLSLTVQLDGLLNL
ncbi:DUF4382 domain-containing protein [Jiulongibacter sp. NS-SX5]|uniref:DUF4382 domain-containing protein n=1 Tax=Jiulongibacter sp. NS-SX5 TaxID=3463854 RepID=UPI004058465B